MTVAARTLYAQGPWVKDTPLDAVLAFQHTTAPHTITATATGSQSQGADGISHLPQTRVFGRTLRGLEAVAATKLHAELGEHRRTCLLSSGGEGAGGLWSTVPSRTPLRIVNAQWATATRSRLGLATPLVPGQSCAMQCAKSDEACSQQLDKYFHHPSICASGKQARMRCHTAVAATVKRHLVRTGAFVDLERAVPELYVETEDGISERLMDVYVVWPGSGRRFLIDATVRSAFATHLHHVDKVPGAAARKGEMDKLAHYGPTVTALAMEPLGRMGADGLALLAALHKESSEYGKPRPGTGRVAPLNTRALRVDLEAVVVSAAAQQVLTSFGTAAVQALGWATAGRAWKQYSAPEF